MQSGSQLVPQRIRRPEPDTIREPLYRVIIHNDEVTPMDFVTHVLVSVFALPKENALSVMYTAHLNGAAYVQTLPRPEAQRRINRAHFAARLNGYPLKFTMERD